MNSSTSRISIPTKFKWRASALLAAGVLALAACSSNSGTESTASGSTSSSSGGDEANVEIRFSWWGSDTRHELTQEVLDLFMEKNPDITVIPEFTGWGGYWDKLATTVAGGDTPDVMTQEERYLTDYAKRGVLADLSVLGLDTTNIDPSVLQAGTIDGQLAGVATGINVQAVIADPQMFADAGVEMPDDTTWTWDDFKQISKDISDALGDGKYGVQDYGENDGVFATFARQHGESLYTSDGTLGFEDATLAAWWQNVVDLRQSGAMPDGSRSVEIAKGGLEQSLVGTSTGAMAIWGSNQLGALMSAAGRDLVLLRIPGESEFARTGMYYKPAMFYSVSKTSKHPEAAARLVDFLVNDPEAGALILSDRGLSANTAIRASVADKLSPAEQQAATFLAALSGDIVDGPPAPPTGAADIPKITTRINQEVLFDTMSPADAAGQFRSEANAVLGQ